MKKVILFAVIAEFCFSLTTPLCAAQQERKGWSFEYCGAVALTVVGLVCAYKYLSSRDNAAPELNRREQSFNSLNDKNRVAALVKKALQDSDNQATLAGGKSITDCLGAECQRVDLDRDDCPLTLYYNCSKHDLRQWSDMKMQDPALGEVARLKLWAVPNNQVLVDVKHGQLALLANHCNLSGVTASAGQRIELTACDGYKYCRFQVEIPLSSIQD